jgi:hypothetical protein
VHHNQGAPITVVGATGLHHYPADLVVPLRDCGL